VKIPTTLYSIVRKPCKNPNNKQTFISILLGSIIFDFSLFVE
jgi:hypothetical protein